MARQGAAGKRKSDSRTPRFCEREIVASCGKRRSRGIRMTEKFERHRQPWRQDEIQKLHLLAGKGMSLRAIAKALTRSEESVQKRAKDDRLKITKLR
jgi:hypothetical protein